ncbi:hypothetical protein MTO96_044304 [Rhipicephalus appendiculatus]
MVPAAKKPRKDPASRRPPALRRPSKRKAESPLPSHEDLGAREEVTEKRQSSSTQNNSNDGNRASLYLVIVKRLRTHVAYQRSKCEELLKELAAEKEKVKACNDDIYYAAIKKLIAGA